MAHHKYHGWILLVTLPRLLILPLLCLAMAGAKAQAKTNTESNDQIYYLINQQSAPLEAQNPQDLGVGVLTRVAQVVLANAQMNATFISLPPARFGVPHHLPTDRPSMHYCSPFFSTSDGEIKLQPAVLHEQFVLLERADNPWQYHGADSLAGRSLLRLPNYNYPGLEQRFRSGGKHGEINDITTNGVNSAINMVVAHRADAFIEFNSRIRYALRQLALDPAQFSIIPMNEIMPKVPISLCMSPDIRPPALARIRDSYRKLWLVGTLQRLVQASPYFSLPD